MMYSDSLLYWIGGTVVIFGILGVVFILAIAIDNRSKKHQPKDKEDEDG